MRRRPLAVRAVALALALAAAACSPSGDAPLTDPREILGRTIAATAGLRTVSLRAELQMRDPNNPGPGPGGINGGVLEADVDLASSAYAARATDASGVEVGRIIAVDQSIFTTTSDGRWTRADVTPELQGNPAALFFGFGMRGVAGVAPEPDYPTLLVAALADPALAIGFDGVQDCGTGRCYVSTVAVPPEAVWPLLLRLLGADQLPVAAPPPPDGLPRLSFSIASDTATLRLVALTAQTATGATTTQLRLDLGNYDGPVSIAPPPANLIDARNGGVVGPNGGPMPPPKPAPPAPAPAP